MITLSPYSTYKREIYMFKGFQNAKRRDMELNLGEESLVETAQRIGLSCLSARGH